MRDHESLITFNWHCLICGLRWNNGAAFGHQIFGKEDSQICLYSGVSLNKHWYAWRRALICICCLSLVFVLTRLYPTHFKWIPVEHLNAESVGANYQLRLVGCRLAGPSTRNTQNRKCKSSCGHNISSSWGRIGTAVCRSDPCIAELFWYADDILFAGGSGGDSSSACSLAWPAWGMCSPMKISQRQYSEHLQLLAFNIEFKFATLGVEEHTIQYLLDASHCFKPRSHSTRMCCSHARTQALHFVYIWKPEIALGEWIYHYLFFGLNVLRMIFYWQCPFPDRNSCNQRLWRFE